MRKKSNKKARRNWKENKKGKYSSYEGNIRRINRRPYEEIEILDFPKDKEKNERKNNNHNN